jgi:hypothetical protein
VAPQDRSGRVRLPLTWPGPRQTIDFGSFLLRHLCLEIGGRAGTRGTLLMTFVGSFHHSKIMLRVLIKVLGVNAIATCRRLPPKGDVTFKDLIRVASDFDVRTVTIEGLTSGRYLLPITVGIVTAIATMRSAGLSWSHDTCCFMEKLNPYPMRAYRNTSLAEVDGVVYAPTAPRHRQEDAFTEEDCVTCSPMPGRVDLLPLDASRS